MKQYECLHCKQTLNLTWEEADGCLKTLDDECLWDYSTPLFRYIGVKCNVFATERNAEGKAYFPEHTLIEIKK